jgi:hypothetical protein
MPARDADSGLTGERLLARFLALDAFLTEHQGLWRPRPFTHLQLPWEAQHPCAGAMVAPALPGRRRSSHNLPTELPAPAPFPALAASWPPAECRGKPCRRAGCMPALPRLQVDVPGRKWQQIDAFGSA